jgi:cell division protein FtsI (penicillin-binding protein 3)
MTPPPPPRRTPARPAGSTARQTTSGRATAGAGTGTRAAPRKAAPVRRTGEPARRRQVSRGAPARPVTARRPPNRPRPGRLLNLTDPRRRLRAACVALAVLMSLFVGRLLQLQAVEAPAYAARAEAGRMRTVVLPATRGQITDINGTVLATSVDAKNVTVDQTLVHDPAATAMALAPLLDIDAATLVQKLTGTRRFAYVAKQITPVVWSQVDALSLPGIFSEDTTTRVYPAGDLAANVVGFVGSDGAGLGGLELGDQSLLAGVNGVDTYEAGAGGREIPTATAVQHNPVEGTTIRTTINSDIQWAAQQALAAAVKSSDADSGTVVVMDPRSGAILALASAPTFDPSDPGAAPVADRGNRALSDIYEPGSTSKVMTAAAVIQEKALTPNSVITVPNTLMRGGRIFHDDVSHGTEHLTLTGVLAKSSNLGAIQAAETIGRDKLYSFIKAFGIGDPTGLDFPGESRGILSPPSRWSDAQFATVSFGQGLSLNAVQATSVYATIANGGVRVEPSLIAGTVGPDGTFTSSAAPTQTRVVSAQTAATVRDMLESVVSDQGTAPMARIPGYRVAGKTGTANRVDDACSCYRGFTASFIGFAPADAPRVVISVTLQNPKNGHFGGRLGGPVFRQVMAFALQTLGIPPTGTVPPRMRLVAP